MNHYETGSAQALGAFYSSAGYGLSLVFGWVNVATIAEGAIGALISTILGITIAHFYKRFLNKYFPDK